MVKYLQKASLNDRSKANLPRVKEVSPRLSLMLRTKQKSLASQNNEATLSGAGRDEVIAESGDSPDGLNQVAEGEGLSCAAPRVGSIEAGDEPIGISYAKLTNGIAYYLVHFR